MKWTIKFENKKKQRILIEYHPLIKTLEFKGQYIPRETTWFDFAIESVQINEDLTSEKVQELVEKIYDDMNKNINAYTQANEVLKGIQIVEIKDEEIKAIEEIKE